MAASRMYRDKQAQYDVEHIARQIARAFQRSGRAVDKSSREMSRISGYRRPAIMTRAGARTRRAPASASQFHLHAKKSRSSGARGSPSCSASKVRYDLGLDEDAHASRVKIAFVSAPVGAPKSARDPLKMAAACEVRARQSRYANLNTGQMLHIDTALPNGLRPDRLAQLAGDINQHIAERFCVPAYSGVHLDHGNFHIHTSISLYEVHDDGKGGFYLGSRINHAKRPAERQALGLQGSPASELRELRKEIANLIANSVAEDLTGHPDGYHLGERWRHGHLTLPQQVERAAQRGDIDFVLDNLNRNATRKEWGNKQSRAASTINPRRAAAIQHNALAGKVDDIPSSELITRTLAHRAIQLAKKAELTSPEQFRMLARDLGLNVSWSSKKDCDAVQGIVFALQGGPKIAGHRLGCSLGAVHRKLKWNALPAYRRFVPKQGPQYEDYLRRMVAAGIRSNDARIKAIRLTINRLEALAQAALYASINTVPNENEQAARPAIGGRKPDRHRPKRRSNDPRFHSGSTKAALGGRKPTGEQAVPAAPPAKEEKDMKVDNLLQHLRDIEPTSVLVSIPQPPQRPPDAGTVAYGGASGPGADTDADVEAIANSGTRTGASAGSRAGGGSSGARAVAPRPRFKVRKRLPVPTELTARQRDLLAEEWDNREASRLGAFDGPLSTARKNLERLQSQLRQQMKAEPWPSEAPRRRLLGGSHMVETSDHQRWRETLEVGHQKAKALELQISQMLDKATHNEVLLAALPQLEARADIRDNERARDAQLNDKRTYARALEQLETSKPGSVRQKAAHATIKRLSDQNLEIAFCERRRRAEAAAAARQQYSNSTDAPAHYRRQRFL